MSKFSRVIALLLCVMMLVGMLPSGVFAAEEEAVVAPVVIEDGAAEEIEPEIPIFEDTSYTFAERAADLIARMSVAQKGAQLITTPAAAIPASSLGGGALNVPLTKNIPQYYWWCESLHGYNRLDSSSKGVYAHDHPYENIGQWGPDNAVSYPQSLTVASTWNPDLYYAEGREVSDEIRELTSRNPYTGNASDLNFYSPTVNMHRDVRWGRNEESYSEDPYLTIKMGSQYVLGMEGKDQDGNLLDPDGYYQAHSTLKHYVANNSEQNRTNGGAVSSLNALRNYYLAPYRGIIKATNVSSIMTAYSTFNGEPCSYSSYLMDTVLRQIYGFEGYVTSDCDSVGTMVQHTKFVNPRTGKSLTNVERLANALAHGEDLECIGGYAGVGNYGSYAQTMIDSNIQTDKGLFTENTMDVSLLRMFTARVATGEFDDDLTFTKEAQARTEAQIAALGEGADIRAIPYNQTKERLDILDQINNEGVVMLQNTDNYLPLELASSGEYKVVIIGAWQTNMYLGLYSAKSTNSYNHVNIQKGLTDAILAKNPDATFTYILNDKVSDADRATIEAADLCIAVCGAAGSYSQEGRDRSSLAMASNQAAMVSQVGKWNPNTIAVLEYCGPVETYTFRDDVKAILWSCFGGIRKGVGFGNIITGVVNPSGKVTDTWFHDASVMPPMLNYDLYPSEDLPGRTYMFYEGDGVDYPFGYGLSFTTYAYSNLSIDKTSYDANETVKVSFDVTNTGKVAGKEIAEMYIAQPGAPAELNRPIRRLEGFEKVELQPGETKTVELEVAIPDLAYYDETVDCYAVDTGAYQVQVGKDSASANLTADFTVTGAMDIYPEVLTVKANAVGDNEKGIEERVIFDNGSIINPQLTVTMNNEAIYGYIIADQQSTIKNMKSCPLPEGMTFTYSTNRPSVVAVNGGEIKAVGPGVATVTVTGELDGHTVTTDFVVYVETKPQAATITVDGKPLEGYQGSKILYEYEVARGAEVPVVAATVASDELSVEVEQAESVPGIAKVIVTEVSSGSAITYQIGIGYKPVSTDFAEGWDAAKAKGWTIVNEDAEKVAFGEDGLTLTPQFGEFGYGKEQPVKNIVVESALGDWVAETTIKPAGNIGKTGATHRDEAGLIVYGDDGNSYRIVYNNRWNASNGVITYQNSRVNVYLVNAGNDNNFSIANASIPAGTEEIHLRMIRVGNTCQAQYSTDGKTWKNLGNTEPLDAALPQVGVFARGNNFTATFDGLNILKVSDVRPQLAELKIDGNMVEGFDPAIYQYNMKLKEPTDKIPVITATPIAEDLDVEITQFDAPTGVATVVVSSAYASQAYTIGLNYGPSYSYLADGTLGDEWTVEGENAPDYKLIQGKGLGVLNANGAALTMPGQGTWAVVAKAYIPKAGQTIGLSVRQDSKNAVNINVQGNNLTVQPSRTNNGTTSTYGYTTTTLVPDENGGATVYFMIDKDATSYTLYCSQDGKDFARLGNIAVTYTNPKIVLNGTQSGEDDEIACFEYVAVPAEDGFDAAITDYKAWACQNVADYVAAALPVEATEDIAFAAVPNGYTLSIASSDPSVIAADGTVVRGAADQQVTLTVTAAEGDVTATAIATVTVKAIADEPVASEYKITAPHAVKLSANKAKAGDIIKVTTDATIEKITASANGEAIAVTKTDSGYSFVVPEGNVSVKVYYSTSAIAALQDEWEQGNPFLPLWDYNPDTEPHVFEDPDNPGQYRLYFCTSHDMNKTSYCSNNHVLYSCPVDDPFNWTYHGVIVGPDHTEHNDTLYAPDMMCVEDPTSPTGKYYYYIPCNQAGGRQTMILRSSRPDGKGDPFTVINWSNNNHSRTTGLLTFDPSFFVDDDGKVYGYWGGYNSTCHGAQLDPATNFTTAIEGTQKDDMLGDGLKGNTFSFFEASSMRKIEDTYVFVYSRQSKNSDPEGSNCNQLGYAYSDSPLGPWTFGGILVDAQGEVLDPSRHTRTFKNGGNTHGSLVKLGDQWYVSYHRNVETNARQAMFEAVDVTVNEDGSVKIKQAEMTSQGFYINGLNPYKKHSIGTACYFTGDGKLQPLYEEGTKTLPINNVRNNTLIGLKYFDFNVEAPEGSSISLNVDLIPRGAGTINVWLRPESDLGVTPFSDDCIKIGSYQLTGSEPQEMTTIEIETPEIANVDGKWGVFYSFANGNGNIADMYNMQFEFADHEHVYKDVVTAPTCLEGGYTTSICEVCGKSMTRDFTAALGHDWDEGVVTKPATETEAGEKVLTCARCGETVTKRIPATGIQYVLANTIEAGKQYVIVSNGYALTNKVAQVSTAYGGTSLGSTAVDVEGDIIISEVLDDMIWDFAVGTSSSNNGYETGYFLTNGESKFLSRNGPTNENPAPLNTQTYDASNVASKPQYCYWVVKDLDDAGNKALFVTGTGEWTFALRGAAAGFDAPGNSNANTVAAANPVKLYERVINTKPTPIPGPTVVADPESPTGYTGKFIYFDDSGEQVYFCGDLMLSYTTESGGSAKTYSPFDYQPGMMRRGGSQFKEPMVDLGGGYWYYELPLTAGANQYWFNTESNTRMLPDPANHPQWSPASNWNTKNAYNAVYVPYADVQDNEVLKAREIENPREGQNNGTWSYVPYKLSEEQADDYYMGVYLPYGYDADRAEPYKTIYVLHGGGQDESDWLGIGSVQNIIDNLYADGRIEDAPILIVPRNTRLGLGNLEATFAFVEKNYNVSTDRMDRAICGLSMGGMMINSLLNDDKKRDGATFGYYGFFSGGNPSNALNSPYLLDSYYYVGSGLYEGNPYNQRLVDSGASYHFTQFAGAHDFNTWCQMFTDFAENYAFKPENFERKLFDDVDANAYYYDAVKWAVDNGITNGFEPGLFAPDNAVTRAQIVTMLWRAAGCPAPTAAATFKDLKAGEYYVDAVAWAVENGITNGVGKNMFAPNDVCTRGQIVTFLWRYMGKPAATAAAEFSDVPADEYYADAVAWAVEAGVTEGYPEGIFKPIAECTRAQAVTFLQRAIA